MSATAPYRFIPIERDFVPQGPVARDAIRFDSPLEGCSVSGVLNVDWTAQTPVCIGDVAGEASENSSRVVEPLKIGQRYCLSGTSLRGMLRAVTEIISFSHLGRINAQHHHGERDFSGIGPFHQVRPQDIQAGWLRWEEDEAGKAVWKIYPARKTKDQSKFILTPISSIVDIIPDANRPSVDQWLQSLSVQEKYEALPPAYHFNAPIKWVYSRDGGDSSRKPSRPGFDRPRVSLKSTGKSFSSPDYPIKDFYLVLTGPFQQEAKGAAKGGENGKRKATEALFPGPGPEGFAIPNHWINIFHRMHADSSREGGNPRGAWRMWLRAMGWQHKLAGFKEGIDKPVPPGLVKPLLGIPVFWKGDIGILKTVDQNNPSSPGMQDFWFSLSRVMRLPHAFSVGHVAQRLYGGADAAPYHVPLLSERSGFDLGRALFGEVDGANIEAGRDSGIARSDGTNRADAQRGRVAVGFAFAPAATKPEREVKRGVFGQPRESFWPFYLRHMDGVAQAGSRKDLTASYSSNGAIPAGRKRTLVRRTAIDFPQGNGNEDVKSGIRFLPTGTRFTGQIRFHNLHPVELGALIYALSLGRPDGSRWHQIGKAKAMGHGALSAQVSFARAPRITGLLPEELDQKKPEILEPWMKLFCTWMSDQLGRHGLPSFGDHASIKALHATANPATAAQLSSNLGTGDIPMFKRIRDDLKAARDGSWDGPYPLAGP
ncbi:hypothetical protein [Rhizobium sp. CECT 9324]|uniref:hypothetical protein n=1 Tax=Rhizobium sp. CECT 9324 TaxID=2845820 RepID=UPI001E44D803|nr:hypothetical protein [Rhizobium sp. CECT 9324]CAH0343035.1 hypothetical protein RHI9324_04768 [Rhizobium sp. CECT 9324]